MDQNIKNTCIECSSEATVFCQDCRTRSEDNECIDGLYLCDNHSGDYHMKVHHNTTDLKLKAQREEQLQNLKNQKDATIRAISQLNNKKTELGNFKHDLDLEKTCYNRHVRCLVKMLQQEVLARGRTLAKELENKIDHKINKVDNFMSDINEQMSVCLKGIGELERTMALEGKEFTEAYEQINKDQQVENVPELLLPEEEAWNLDTASICLAVEQLGWQKNDIVKVKLPTQQLAEGESLEVTIAGLWTSQRPTFAVVKRDRQAASALYDYSKLIRRAYLEDKDWKTYQDVDEAPPVNERVFAKFSEDNTWYRGKIISNEAFRKESEVLLVDYAQVVTLKWTHLLPSKEELYTDTEPWAFECTFDENINPLTSREARWWFNTTAASISESCVPVKCLLTKQVKVKEMPVWLVEMEVTKADGITVDIGKEVRDKLKAGLEPTTRMASRDIREEFVKHTVMENPKNTVKLDAQKLVESKEKEITSKEDHSEDNTTEKMDTTVDKTVHDASEEKCVAVSDTTMSDVQQSNKTSNENSQTEESSEVKNLPEEENKETPLEDGTAEADTVSSENNTETDQVLSKENENLSIEEPNDSDSLSKSEEIATERNENNSKSESEEVSAIDITKQEKYNETNTIAEEGSSVDEPVLSDFGDKNTVITPSVVCEISEKGDGQVKQNEDQAQEVLS